MIIRILTAVIIVVASTGGCFADESDSGDSSHIRHFDLLYKPLIGKRVIVDAVVWYDSKRGAEIMTPSGQGIYLRYAYISKDGRLEQRLPQGTLVRVTGILSFEPYSRFDVPLDAVEKKRLRSDLNLTIESFKLIERADRPWPVLCDDAPLPAEDTTSSEQDGAPQPATRPESKAE